MLVYILYVSYYNYYIHVAALDYIWLCGYNGLHEGTVAGLHMAIFGYMWQHRQLHTYGYTISYIWLSIHWVR